MLQPIKQSCQTESQTNIKRTDKSLTCIKPINNLCSNMLKWKYEYNEAGLISRVISPGNKSTDLNYSYTGNESNSIISVSKNTTDENTIFQFNKLGQLLKMEDTLGTVIYQYSNNNQQLRVQRENQPAIDYEFNTDGTIQSISIAGSFVIEYKYDYLGRLATIITPVGIFKNNFYSKDSITEKILPNGIKTQYKYFPDGNLESIIHVDRNNYIISKYTYSYNANNLVKHINEWTNRGEFGIKYKYDEEHRLISCIDRDKTKLKYEYDNFGNRTKSILNERIIENNIHNKFGQLISINDITCYYDNSGNFNGTGNNDTYLYNHNNRLTYTQNVNYEYDGQGKLITRSREGNKTTYITNPLSNFWQPLLEIRRNGDEIFYIWEGDLLLGKIENDIVHFFLPDHLNSIRYITDKGGSISAQINYNPYGIPNNTHDGNNLFPGFAGMFYDPVAKIYIAGERAYHPGSGRFLQIDPMHHIPDGSQKDLSLYGYCGGDPINFTDREGTQSKRKHKNPEKVQKLSDKLEITDPQQSPLSNTENETKIDASTDGTSNTKNSDGGETVIESSVNSPNILNIQNIFLKNNPLEIISKAHKFTEKVLDHYSPEKVLNKPQPFGNNPTSNVLYTQALKHLFESRNRLKSYFDDTKYSFTAFAINQFIGDMRTVISNKISPLGNFTSNQIKYSLKIYNQIKNFPKIYGSVNDRLDYLLGFATPLGGQKTILEPLLKAYYGLIFNALNYNPRKRLLRKYGKTKTYYNRTSNTITTTSAITYNEQNVRGKKTISILNDDNPLIPSQSTIRESVYSNSLDFHNKRIAGKFADNYRNFDNKILSHSQHDTTPTPSQDSHKICWKAFNNAFWLNIVEDWRHLMQDPVGELTNWYGIGTNWGGKNRSGDNFSREKDRYGQYPLGDRNVPAKGLRDKFYRLHDIQYYVDAHYKKGDIVNAGTEDSPEYFISRGDPESLFSRNNLQLYFNDLSAYTPFRLLQYFFKYKGYTKLPKGYLESDVIKLDTEDSSTWTRYKTDKETTSSESQKAYNFEFDEPEHPEPEKDDDNIKDTQKYYWWWGGDDKPPPVLVGDGGGGDDEGGGAAIGGSTNDEGYIVPLPPPVPITTMPSNIGGVYLKGVGNSLSGIQSISGIAIDEISGKIILLSDEETRIDLPALRLDDVVTIFKSVYLHGEAPFVSIDPNPKNPKGPTMLTRHGLVTNNTYVGWILFEADRIMKAYSLGEDNITKNEIQSQVEGYAEVQDAMFSGDNKKETWERFWIVPASVEKHVSDDEKLTLMKVPLKVNTQKMILRKGKLEPDTDGEISEKAKKFSEWFTLKYDQIADESYSLPPNGSGFNKPVPVFKELQRIAMITAIAEHLRNNGIDFPFWMHNHNVQKFSIPETTPAHTVEREKGNIKMTVYGGVALSPEDKDVVETASSPAANKINSCIKSKIKKQQLFETYKLETKAQAINATALPGSNTKALAPCILSETDLSVKIQGDYYLNFNRKYNSFFTPLDNLFGENWSLDLPFLEKRKVPESRNGDEIEYRTDNHIITPLNTLSEKVEQLYVGENKKINFKTQMIIRDNAEIHFNEDGYLVAYVIKPVSIIYKRDKNNRIIKTEGYYGKKLLAHINLEYDSQNRIKAINGNNGDKVKYYYSSHNQLGYIVNNGNKKSYGYHNGLVSSLGINNEIQQQFTYNEKGQLLNSSYPNGKITDYTIKNTINGDELITSSYLKDKYDNQKTSDKIAQSVAYDQNHRPVKQVLEDGTIIISEYTDNDVKINIDNKRGYHLAVTKSGNTVEYMLPNGERLIETYDKHGRLNSLKQNDQLLFEQVWNDDGSLAQTKYPGKIIHQQYNQEGLIERKLITPLVEGASFNEWTELKQNEKELLTEISDHSGLKLKYTYDANGDITQVESNSGTVKIKNEKGKIKAVDTSWGENKLYDYHKKGELKQLVSIKKDKKSLVKFENGKIKEIKDFNGGRYQLNFENNNIKNISTPLNIFTYDYNGKNQLQSATCKDQYQAEYKYDANDRLCEICLK